MWRGMIAEIVLWGWMYNKKAQSDCKHSGSEQQSRSSTSATFTRYRVIMQVNGSEAEAKTQKETESSGVEMV